MSRNINKNHNFNTSTIRPPFLFVGATGWRELSPLLTVDVYQIIKIQTVKYLRWGIWLL